MKIKCISNYNHNGTAGILQVFYNNRLEAKYSRLRVYKGINPDSKKPIFDWTKVPVTPEIQTLLREKLDQSAAVQNKSKSNIEQSTQNSSPNQNSIFSGASGGLRSRDHYLTKVTPHLARLPRHIEFSLNKTCAMK